MKATKQQKDYLKGKIATAVREAKYAYAEARPTEVSDAEKIAALKKAGFVGNDIEDFRYVVRYAKMPQTAVHKKNQAAIDKYNAEMDVLKSDAFDAIELGDDADALEFLKKFQQDLKKVK